MEEQNLTASAILHFAERLEDYASGFYEKIAEEYPRDREIFLTFVKESKRNRILVTRTYQETITDAIEACFCFRQIKLQDYMFEPSLPDNETYDNVLRTAVTFEDKASRFYSQAAEFSKSFLAAIQRSFLRVSENRRSRKFKLESLLVQQNQQ